MPYAPGPMAERSPEEDDRRRRDYNAQSPTHSHPYSPINGAHPQSPYNQYSSRPSTSAAMSLPPAISPRLGPPPSPKMNGPSHNGSMYHHRESSGSTRYDPISEHREGQTSWRTVAIPYTFAQRGKLNLWQSMLPLLPLLSLLPVSSTSADHDFVVDPRARPLC